LWSVATRRPWKYKRINTHKEKENKMKIEKTVYQTVPAGQYVAKVAEIEERADGAFGPYLLIKFELADGNYDGIAISGATSAKYSNKSKLGRWTRNIIGSMPDMLDTDALVGRKCLLDVTIANTKDGEFNRVEEVYPFRQPAPQRTPQTELNRIADEIPGF
jgi:hypothetical protein